MKKQHKMDPNLISTKQVYELDWVIERFRKKLDIGLTRQDVKDAVKAVGKSRRKVYAHLERTCAEK